MAGVSSVLLCILYINLFTYTTMADGEHEVNVSQDKGCPLWTYPNNITCECGDRLSGTIECNNIDKTVSIKSCYCMTLDESTSQPIVSDCLYTCYTVYSDIRESHSFNLVGTNTTANLNNVTCGRYNRKGTACGECIKGHSLPVYSYSLSCVECSDYKYNWLKYIAVAYIPLTLFYFTVIIFRISATSGSMIGYVTVSQMMATYSLVKLYLTQAEVQSEQMSVRIIAMLYSIWNLDFFRSLYPPFCLHPKLTALQVMILDYLVAVYPMILVFLTYLFVKFDERFRLTMWLCWPVYKCFRHFRKELNIKSSLISAFATMLLLSYVKILNVTTNILSIGYHYDMYGNYGLLHVYYDPNTLYLSKEHLPYFITAITMSLVFNIIPLLLLCIYPCRCFRRCLNSTGLQHQVLHTFMDSFQGCYKHKPLNFRFFTAVYMITQIVNLTIYIVAVDRAYHPLSCYMLILVIILLAISQPHKNIWHNVIDITLFTSVLISYMSFTFQLEGIYSNNILGNRVRYLFYGRAILLPLFIPPIYGLLLFIGGIMPLKIKEAIVKELKRVFSRNQRLEESLPQRLQECTPLINH